ncbi:hypothetical protein, partial [Klebsiella pneumoniae]|uniref:hypothetical protein n=1 Tax=Klebsiella pneumoniae TaxID=573 RepID=UPI0025A2E8F8
HKGVGILGDREGYPDFNHSDGYRIELKGLFIDNPEIELKLPQQEENHQQDSLKKSPLTM